MRRLTKTQSELDQTCSADASATCSAASPGTTASTLSSSITSSERPPVARGSV